jgi:hypothetical protein
MPKRALWVGALPNTLEERALWHEPLIVLVKIEAAVAADDASASQPVLAYFVLDGPKLRDDVSLRAVVAFSTRAGLECLADFAALQGRLRRWWQLRLKSKNGVLGTVEEHH